MKLGCPTAWQRCQCASDTWTRNLPMRGKWIGRQPRLAIDLRAKPYDTPNRLFRLTRGEQFGKPGILPFPDDNDSILIPPIHLPHQFAAPSAGRQNNAILIDRDDQTNLRLARLQHLRDRGMLRAKADSALDVHTNA